MARKAVTHTLGRTPWLQKALRDGGRYFPKELLSLLLLPPKLISALYTLDKKRRFLAARFGLRRKASWSEIDQEVRRRLTKTWQKAGIPINGEPSWSELAETFAKLHRLEGFNKHIFTEKIVLEELMLVTLMDVSGITQ